MKRTETRDENENSTNRETCRRNTDRAFFTGGGMHVHDGTQRAPTVRHRFQKLR